MNNQTLLIGVDAGDFRTIDPLLEAGELPHLQGLINGGVHGSLSSSIPPWTPTAWTSLTTGKNPGKHGIFDFKMPRTDELVDSGDVRTNTIWDYLSAAGESSLVLNVPVTHPVAEMDGVLVPGYLGPEVDEAVAHPTGILEELQEAIGTYRIYKSDDVTDGDELCEEYRQLMQMRADAMSYLCDAYEWSFAMVQFQRTDTVFHELPEKEYIQSVYRKLDECVGQLLSEVDADNVIVASDHGMGETSGWDFRINSWLLENGYLATGTEGFDSGWSKPDSATETTDSNGGNADRSPIAKAANGAARIGITPRRVEHGLKRLGIDDFVKRILPEEWVNTALEAGGERIDVEASAAYCPSGPGLGIVCRNAEPDPLIGELSTLTDPDGAPVFEWVRRVEEVHHGPAVDAAPDVIPYPRGMAYYISATLSADVFAKSRYAYNHMQDGILLGAGSDIATVDERIEADITDVAPTVLSLVGVTLDEAFDGGPVESLLDGVELPETRTYTTVDRAAGTEDRDAVEARLEDLGYME